MRMLPRSPVFISGTEIDWTFYLFVTLLIRLERDLYSRVDQFGVEIRERTKWDIRESMVGTETFEPKHVVIATWKNVSFAGGIPIARRTVWLNDSKQRRKNLNILFRQILFKP